jgi:hypothetical protein
MRATLKLTAIAATALLLLTGCAATVALKPAASATSAKCATVVAQLPQTASSLDRRETNAQGTGAWGSTAQILLYCGVPVPDPTATLPCSSVNGIDWLLNAGSKSWYVFTTYGRTPAVSVWVSSQDVKADSNAALTDLSLAVGTIKAEHKCSSPSAVLEGGQPVTTPTPRPTTTPGPDPRPTTTPGATPTP